MWQLNIYVPEDLEDKIRKEASRRGLSVSAFVAELAVCGGRIPRRHFAIRDDIENRLGP